MYTTYIRTNFKGHFCEIVVPQLSIKFSQLSMKFSSSKINDCQIKHAMPSKYEINIYLPFVHNNSAVLSLDVMLLLM